MSRYIDADSLPEFKFVGADFEKYRKLISDGELKMDDAILAYKVGYNEAVNEIVLLAPTVDVVEVTRCKDCKRYNNGFECLKEGYGIEYPPDYYCADGKRRTDG